MKSPRSSTPASHKQQDLVDNELTLTIGNQVSESAKIIYNIKQSLYELMKINVNATVPLRKYDTAPAIVAGSKRNLDDLRRIQSMIKGYLNTIRLESDHSEEEVDTKLGSNRSGSFHNSSSPNTSKILAQAGGASLKTDILEQQPITTIFTTTPLPTVLGPIGKTQSQNNTTNQVNLSNISQIKDNSKFNVGLGQSTGRNGDRELGNILQDQGCQVQKVQVSETQTQVQKNTNQMPAKNITKDSEIHAKPLIKEQQSPQPKKPATSEQAVQSPSDLKTKTREQSKQESHFSTKDKKLKSCKSAIFSTSRNLHDIRSRNRQCLELIRSIKKQIGIRQ